MKKTLAGIVFILAIMSSIAVASVTIHFTRTDGSLWMCSGDSAGAPILLSSSGNAAIGTHAPTYAGATYTIDTQANTLLKDGVVIGTLHWSAGAWDVQPHYGFAIDSSGMGWLMTTDSDADNQTFLLNVNLSTAEVTYVGYAGPSSEDLFQVNGLVLYEFGGVYEDF